ncbi:MULTISPECIES: hypothetical protein [Flavobacteriales]|uniref:hypothetical protein n=1 Tax=Flavobacteriales TaxID=200644 RepID=UPI000A6CB713|nr:MULTISPECIES: hypothetical protein [Flavobacteriales]MDT9499810.1 hypothetical protein [Capnocytophaga canimorsus]PJI83865.1 hypothetical protein CLV61_0475 [Capnocytophaga canimorsus]STA72208.1 Uncharacterised protein [Capnocytophaga canimorsus]
MKSKKGSLQRYFTVVKIFTEEQNELFIKVKRKKLIENKQFIVVKGKNVNVVV